MLLVSLISFKTIVVSGQYVVVYGIDQQCRQPGFDCFDSSRLAMVSKGRDEHLAEQLSGTALHSMKETSV